MMEGATFKLFQLIEIVYGRSAMPRRGNESRFIKASASGKFLVGEGGAAAAFVNTAEFKIGKGILIEGDETWADSNCTICSPLSQFCPQTFQIFDFHGGGSPGDRFL